MMNIKRICGGTLKLDLGFPAKWIRGVGLISDYSQMAWLIRCPLELHLPLNRCVQGQGKTSWDYTELFMSRHPELYQNPPRIQREIKWSLGPRFHFCLQAALNVKLRYFFDWKQTEWEHFANDWWCTFLSASVFCISLRRSRIQRLRRLVWYIFSDGTQDFGRRSGGRVIPYSHPTGKSKFIVEIHCGDTEVSGIRLPYLDHPLHASDPRSTHYPPTPSPGDTRSHL